MLHHHPRQNIKGQVAVRRCPVLQPSDIASWQAVEWPKHLWAIPNNVIVVSTKGGRGGPSYFFKILCGLK